MSQKGKVALVTGGAQGIGRAMVESLLEAGASVAICDMNKKAGKETFSELSKKFYNRVLFLECDITNDERLEGSFRTTINRFLRLDIVVNNAAINNERETGWRNLIAINLVAVIQSTKLGMKHMSKENGGKGGIIVNIGSHTSQERWPSLPVYSATKAAINQFSRSLGDDLYYKKTGVKVLTLNPGWTNTPMAYTPCSDDLEVLEHLDKHLNTKYIKQSPECVGKGLIEILEKGENGSRWTVENCNPPVPTVEKDA